MEEKIKARNVPIEETDKQRGFINELRAANERYLSENGRRRKAFVMTLGCQQNEADSEKLSGMAEAMGYEIVYGRAVTLCEVSVSS